jgi:hypothetical protein
MRHVKFQRVLKCCRSHSFAIPAQPAIRSGGTSLLEVAKEPFALRAGVDILSEKPDM